MAIIFNEEGLRDISPPCVAQTFINHNALLHKIFVVGDDYYLVERPSVKNFTAGGKFSTEIKLQCIKLGCKKKCLFVCQSSCFLDEGQVGRSLKFNWDKNLDQKVALNWKQKICLFALSRPTEKSRKSWVAFLFLFFLFPFITLKNSEFWPIWTLFFKMFCSPGHRILKKAVQSSKIKCSLANMTLFLCLCYLLVFVLNQMWDELTHPLFTSYYL